MVVVVAPRARPAHARAQDGAADRQHHHAGDQVEPRVEVLGQDVLREGQRHHPQREHPDRVRDRHRRP